jgi:regulation of enolase protein 1 (concanavalin A-like superfamily)
MGWVLRESHQASGVRSESARRLRIEHFEKSLQIAEQHGLADWQARARVSLAYVLSQFRYHLPRAELLLRETLQAPEVLSEEDVQEAYARLMQVCAMQGKWDEVAAALRQSIPFGAPSTLAHWHPSWAPSPATPLATPFGTPGTLAHCLGPMEDTLDRAGKQAEFIAFCEEAKALYDHSGLPLPLNQWYLQPATPSQEFRQLLFRDDFDALELRPEWQWHDPAQVSAYSLLEKPGCLTLRAGLGANLWPRSNLNAPRMLLEVRGDFALETQMTGDWDAHSAISGLLVWKDVLNYVRLEKYSVQRWQHGSIQLEARIGGELQTVGRGLLRGNAFHLRIERTGDRFAALCSADGVHWLTCGQVVLPVKDPLLVGVAALEGMVVHFDYVQVLGRG